MVSCIVIRGSCFQLKYVIHGGEGVEGGVMCQIHLFFEAASPWICARSMEKGVYICLHICSRRKGEVKRGRGGLPT